MKIPRLHCTCSFATLVGTTLWQFSIASAADGTWTDTGPGPSNWSDATKWSGEAIADGSGFAANFTPNIAATTVVTLDSDRTVGSVTFSDSAASGSAWTLAGGSTLTIAGGSSIITTTTSATISANLAGGFTKAGGQTLFLTGTNSGLTGAVSITGGVLSLDSTANSLGAASSINANGGILSFNNATATNYSIHSLTTRNDVRINNGSTLSINSGALNFGTTNFWIQTSAGATGFLTSGTGILTVTAGTVTATDQSIRTIIKDNGSAVGLTKEGVGKVNLTQANTYTGGTIVNTGTLQLGDAIATDYGGTGRLRGTVTVNAGATLLSQGGNTFGYTAGAKVNAVNLQGGTLSHAGNGDNGWGVAYTLAGGTMQTTGTGAFAFGGTSGANTSVTTLASAATSTIAGKITLRSDNANTNVDFTVADGAAANDLTVSAAMGQTGSVGITKLGSGTMILSGANTYTGATVINAGVLKLTGGGNRISQSSQITINAGGTLDIAETNAISRDSLTHATIIVNGGTLTQSAGNHAHIGNIILSNGATWTATSTGSFDGVNSDLDGNVTVTGSGTQTIGTFTSGLRLASRDVTFTVADTTGDAASDLNVAAPLKGTRGFVKDGAGTMTLSSANTYSGTTTVSAGALVVNNTSGSGTGSGGVSIAAGAMLKGSGSLGGTTTISGIHAPGNSVGLQSFGNGLVYTSSALLSIEMIGDDLGLRGTDFDTINLSGGLLSIDPAATLSLAASGMDYSSEAWDTDRSFNLILVSGGTYGGELFQLDTSSAGPFTGEGSWSLSGNSGGLFLNWSAVPEPSTVLLGGLGILAMLRRRR